MFTLGWKQVWGQQAEAYLAKVNSETSWGSFDLAFAINFGSLTHICSPGLRLKRQNQGLGPLGQIKFASDLHVWKGFN